MEFFRCKQCGNMLYAIDKNCEHVTCCGQKMELIKPNTTDAALEKHVPVVTIDGNNVKVVVGSTLHPMTNEHNISWIALETTKGVKINKLVPTDTPGTSFALDMDEKVLCSYAYCNLHGLWMAEV